MRYGSVAELYDDLKEVINDVELIDNTILVKYQSNELKLLINGCGYFVHI